MAGDDTVRPILRLWGSWVGTSLSGVMEHSSLLDARINRIDLESQAKSFGPAISLGFSAGSRWFVEGEISFYYGWGSFHDKLTPQESSSSVPSKPRESESSATLWALYLLTRIGYGNETFGAYLVPPFLPPGVLMAARSNEAGINLAGIVPLGLGVYFGDKVFFVEGFQYFLDAGTDRREGSFIENVKDSESSNYSIRIGIDVLRLFHSSEDEVTSAPKTISPPQRPPPKAPQQPEHPPSPEVLPQHTSEEGLRQTPQAQIVANEIVINQRIHFDFDRARINPDSYPILDEVVGLLKRHPEIKKVQIQGHTDDQGTDEYNQTLSERRAAAVRDYLILKGIDSYRLEAVGFGRSRPLASGTSEEVRAKNRRTEFIILRKE